MKKVRMAIGAAVPAMGMLALPAATAHAATSGAKPAHLGAHRMARPLATDANCTGGQWGGGASPNGNLILAASWGPVPCIGFQEATLNRAQKKLTERVRFWTNTNPNKLLRQEKRGGTISGNATYFWSSPDFSAHEVCAALVTNSTSNQQYGPACVYPHTT